MTNQEHIDSDVAALGTGLAAIEAEIVALKAQVGAGELDFTGLDAVTAQLVADATPVEPSV